MLAWHLHVNGMYMYYIVPCAMRHAYVPANASVGKHLQKSVMITAPRDHHSQPLQHKCLRRGLLLSDYLFNICLLYTIGTQGAEALV